MIHFIDINKNETIFECFQLNSMLVLIQITKVLHVFTIYTINSSLPNSNSYIYF